VETGEVQLTAKAMGEGGLAVCAEQEYPGRLLRCRGMPRTGVLAITADEVALRGSVAGFAGRPVVSGCSSEGPPGGSLQVEWRTEAAPRTSRPATLPSLQSSTMSAWMPPGRSTGTLFPARRQLLIRQVDIRRIHLGIVCNPHGPISHASPPTERRRCALSCMPRWGRRTWSVWSGTGRSVRGAQSFGWTAGRGRAGVVLVSRGIRDVQPFRCRRAMWWCGAAGVWVSGWRYFRGRRSEPSPAAGGWSGRLPSRQLPIWSTESGR
jgi:hypothetical protein